ncbi:MAG TPA: Uma2 family endonuclease [Thermoanaerobaculia bacterium]|nr:Uma2 family endonuclease [Thermoanaerobaculia bacterium]
MAAIPLHQEIEYPTSDGQPMAETSLHLNVMFDLIMGLRNRYREVPDVWVGGNLFLCYQEGNPRAAVAPDVLLAKGVRKYDRDNYLLWQERPPSLVVEVTSRSTKGEDQKRKKGIYEQIGVEEYILFDPYAEYLNPSLQGFRLLAGKYLPILLNPDGSLLSQTSGVLMRREGEKLRMFDVQTRKPLPWFEETGVTIDELDRKLEAERRARLALEEEVARLRQDLERRSG